MAEDKQSDLEEYEDEHAGGGEHSLPETETVSVTIDDSQARHDHEGVPQGPSDQRITQDSLRIGHNTRLW